MIRSILIAVAASSGCASAVHVAAYATEGMAIASLGCDAVSTHESLAGHPNRIEMNDSVLGQHPSVGREAAYFGGIGAGVVAWNEGLQLAGERGDRSSRRRVVADLWRIAANVVILAVEIDSVENNQPYAKGCGL